MADELLDETISVLAEEGISESSEASTLFFGSIFSAEEDAQGRVVLPTPLKRMAGINKNIITLGKGKRLEIWSAENYYDYIGNANYDKALKQLGI